MTIEKTILKHLLYDEDYTRQVLPYLEPDYFRDPSDKVIFDLASKFIAKYTKCPTVEALAIELDRSTGIHNNIIIDTKQTLNVFKQSIDGVVADQWLVDTTERFCQEQAVYRAVAIGASIVDGKSKLDPGILPKLLQDALAVSFDKKVGHEYLTESTARWEAYNNVELKIPFDIDLLNEFTDGGLARQTLNVLIAPVNTGKTLWMCHMASAHLARGLNVLYLTLEMSEIEIAKRIDANLLDVPIKYLRELSKEKFESKFSRIRAMTKGKLMIKQFATKSAHVGNFRFIINELKLKQGFVPDVVYIDYINNTKDQQGATDLYSQVKNVTEDLRGLAVEQDVVMVSATQVNRDGVKAGADMDMQHTAESWGLPQTVDWMLAFMCDPDNPDQFLCKEIKSRYGNKDLNGKLMIGVDRDRQRIYQLTPKASAGLTNKNQKKISKPVNKPNNTLFGDNEDE